MAISIGTRIGPYEITGMLGAGGMGEVYRARDSRLKREVALKILPASFATDSDRLARFQREAEVLASLNHPNIAAIYGFEDALGISALVMELVEGDTLEGRIARGPIPVEEAVPVARQIAEALEAAHEQGIIHRDLKPANVKLRPDGKVKVLDFGLAKALESPATVTSTNATASPTITSPAMMTGVGVVLGTAAYMSPEQARGRAVDKRSDIWAFGCVLYEMLTGQRAFGGDDVTETLASIVKTEPAWNVLPDGLPRSIRSFLRRCLHKDPRQRLHDISDMRLALEGGFDTDEAPSYGPSWKRSFLVAPAALIAALLAGVGGWALRPAVEPSAVSRFTHELPGSQVLFANRGRSVIAVSPDGRSFAYNTTAGLYLRSMGDLDALLIPGVAANAGDRVNPFFAHDGESIGYFEEGQLKRVPVGGGSPVVICAAGPPFGANWAPDNTILFGQANGIMRVSADGGVPELVIPAKAAERFHGPQLLPDGETVLFAVSESTWDNGQIVTQSLRTGERTIVLPRGMEPRYVSTGHLLYGAGDGLFAIRFNVEDSAVSGGSVSVAQRVSRSLGGATAAVNYDVSRQGTLIYLPDVFVPMQLTWFDRAGAFEQAATNEASSIRNFSLAPDENRVAVALGGLGVWITNLQRNVSSRLVAEGGDPIWSPDGTRVAFDRGSEFKVLSLPANGGEERLVFQGQIDGIPYVEDWHPDGTHLALVVAGGGRDQGAVVSTVGNEPPVVFDAAGDLDEPHFSPDGKWIAYNADRDGQGMEVYLVPYPPTGERIQVSASGGVQPRWRADGGEIFYLTLDGVLMAVEVTRAKGLVLGVPRPLFETKLTVVPNMDQYAVSRSGQRFLLAVPAAASDEVESPHIVVVQNWFEELKRLVPTN